MKQENLYRQPAIERLIEKSADGLLHTVRAEEEPPKKRRKRECTEREQEEINICLNCPRERCELDTNEFCARYRAEIKKRREKQHHDKG